MEILVAIAGKLAEYTVAPIGHQVGYLAHYKRNHRNLQTKLEDLGAAREEVEHKVVQAMRGGKRIETTVLNWKRRVDAIITEAEEFLKDGRHTQTECLHGFCPHLVLRYQLSRKSAKLVEEIAELYGKKDFSNLAYDVPLQDPSLLSTGNYHAFASRDSKVREVMDELRNPDTEMILVWGIGGVGKTTLVEEVLRQATDDKLFDDVVMVRDVKGLGNPDRVQKEIATKLGMSINENHSLAERAPILCARIKDKRVLVALDDVWEKIDLVAIGLPRLVNCKVLLTSRLRKEYSLDMRRQIYIPLDVLNEDEAWSLFEKMVGDVVKDSRIRSVAIEVAKKCGRLPILIVTVARALKDRTKMSAWKDTLRRLEGFDKKELKEKAYLALEWSYNQLEDKELKPLFLLCGIIVVKNHIYLGDLLKYGFGLGLIKNVYTIEEARDALDALVEKLKDSCLLLDSDKNMHVRMHDLVCEVAAWIASREQHVLSVEYGAELKEWPDKDFFKRCTKMSLKSSNIPMLSQVPAEECQKLEMIYLYNEYVASTEIPSYFFTEMKKLKVLGITEIRMTSLPSSVECLKNLQTLSLKACKLEDVTLVGHLTNLETLSFARSTIRQLPKEIGELIRLKWLDLSDCGRLEVISPNVLSRLEKLEELTMRNVFLNWEGERGRSNIASLLELKNLSHLTALEMYIEDANILPPNLFSSNLVRYQIYIGKVWKSESLLPMAQPTLNELKLELTSSNELGQGIITLLKKCEDLSLDGSETVNSIVRQLNAEDLRQLIHLRLNTVTYIIDRKAVFPYLTTLSVNRLNHLNLLLSFSMAKSLVELKHLEVSECVIMEEIVSTRDQLNGENIDIVFCKLETLKLYDLPNLARFCTESSIELSLVKKFDMELGASIVDPTSSKKLDGKSGTAVLTCLFDAQIKFPSLERLELCALGKLQTLWNNKKLADQDSFQKLREVETLGCDSLMNIFVPRMMRRLNALETLRIWFCDSLEAVFEVGRTDVEEISADTSSSSPGNLKPFHCPSLGSVDIMGCDRLKNIFPASVARGLQKLYDLNVAVCDEVEEIIGGEQGLKTELPLFEFPKVRRVYLSDLPKLCRFYPGMHVSKWPSLTYLYMCGCNRVKMFAAELPNFKGHPLIEQSLFLIEKDSFPNLELLDADLSDIWYGPSSPAEFFSRLKSITFGSLYGSRDWTTPFSKQATIDFLQKLQKLATLCVRRNDFTELFVSQEINSGEEIHPVGLSGVKTLEIYCMDKLLQLGNGNSQTAGPLFPNLGTLDVGYCELLKSLESSSISFRYLTNLKVQMCRRLEYLTSYSVAKSLTQLTRLEVEYCYVLREIIGASNEDDHDTEGTCEIAFSRLQYVRLWELPSLRSFCSGNCTVRLPSSTELDVMACPIELKISSEGVLLSNEIPN
nr:PREDICTED: probable disease resistance protein At4g27220 isoform X2 [Fragaria vesca subsp. vesca]XP_011464415.1 PREDICTED: probable disease resistance protein At4g27220 isoform X2 [Fragaria vesca subsp. vesca]